MRTGWTLLIPAVLFGCAQAPRPSPYRARFREERCAREVVVAGHSIHVLDRGRGPAVLLLHGLGGSAYDFRFQIDALVDAGFRVLVPDLVGVGYSDKPAEWDYTIPAQAEMIAGLLDALGVDKAHVGGNSYGGGVALALVLKHPSRVDRLILIDAACYPQEIPWHLKVLRVPPFSDLVLALLPPRWSAKAMLKECFHDPSTVSEEELAEYMHEFRFTGASRALLTMASRLDDSGAMEFHQHISEIRSRTLILWGRHDKIVPVAHAERLHSEIAGSKLVVLESCGHVPHMEYPSSVNRTLLRFLRSEGE